VFTSKTTSRLLALREIKHLKKESSSVFNQVFDNFQGVPYCRLETFARQLRNLAGQPKEVVQHYTIFKRCLLCLAKVKRRDG